MAGRRFAHFHVDIANGDVWLDTHEKLTGKEWFDFAGIPAQKILAISNEQQFNVEERLKRLSPETKITVLENNGVII